MNHLKKNPLLRNDPLSRRRRQWREFPVRLDHQDQKDQREGQVEMDLPEEMEILVVREQEEREDQRDPREILELLV